MTPSARTTAQRYLGLSLATLCAVKCTSTTRFALRPPVTREADDRPFRRMPEERASDDLEAGMDEVVLRPAAHGLLFEPGHRATNVNSYDEVPDSSWYTNRTPTPEQSAQGPCVDAP